MTQTTIKQHLTDAIYKNELLCKLGNGDHDGNSNGNVIAQDIRRHLSAIEAEIDRPMLSAEELVRRMEDMCPPMRPTSMQWAQEHYNKQLAFIRAIQNDARTSKPDDVDLRKLSEETADDAVRSSSVMRFRDALVEHIYAALLKARGEKCR